LTFILVMGALFFFFFFIQVREALSKGGYKGFSILEARFFFYFFFIDFSNYWIKHLQP